MQIRLIAGQRCTDRRGAAEYLGRSYQWVKLRASQRAETGFPTPVQPPPAAHRTRPHSDQSGQEDPGHEQGREWYALADLDRFKTNYIDVVKAASMARVHGEVDIDGDDDELINAQRFAEILQIEYATFRSWVRDSKDLWQAGKPGWGGLPIPDHTEPAKRGVIRKWRLGTVRTYIRNRPGAASSPGRPKANADPA